MVTPELWRDVPGYAGAYEVSSHGRVRNKQTGQILTVAHDEDGRCGVVRLFDNKVRRELSLAKLVWEAFHGPVPPGFVVGMRYPHDRSLRNLELRSRDSSLNEEKKSA